MKILKELLKDGRKSFSQIAKDCSVSESAIWKRFREMKKSGIIVGATIQLDYPSFGYNAVGNILFKAEPKRADQVVEQVRKMPNIHDAWRTAKTSEINAVTTLESLEKLEGVKDRIRKIPSVSELRTYIWIGVRNIRENLAITLGQKMAHKMDEKNEHAANSSKKARIRIDETDKRIIEILAVNGRASFRSLAKELKISTDTVARRYVKLKQSGAIKVSIQLDPAKIGYHGLAVFYIAFVSQDSLISIVESLAKIPDIVLIIQTSGSYDLLVEAMVRDIDHILLMQDVITSISGVTRMEMHLNRPAPVFPTPREYISTF